MLNSQKYYPLSYIITLRILKSHKKTNSGEFSVLSMLRVGLSEKTNIAVTSS